jgi:hypothetical protein
MVKRVVEETINDLDGMTPDERVEFGLKNSFGQQVGAVPGMRVGCQKSVLGR